MKSTCWFCYPDLNPGCVRPSSLLCDEHRVVEHNRLQVLKDKYAHLSVDEQAKLWRKEQRAKSRRQPEER